jgi:hypothetical protein
LKSRDPYQTIALIEDYRTVSVAGWLHLIFRWQRLVSLTVAVGRRSGACPSVLQSMQFKSRMTHVSSWNYIDYLARSVKNVPVDVFRTYVGSTRKLALATLEQPSSGELLAAIRDGDRKVQELAHRVTLPENAYTAPVESEGSGASSETKTWA